MPRLHVDKFPEGVDGPGLVAAASALMLLPENASRLLRLHRLAALGMALSDNHRPLPRPNTVRSLLRRNDIGGAYIKSQEDPYSEVLIQSIRFIGGPYLVSPGTGEHTVADLENLVEALFRAPGLSNQLVQGAKLLIQGILTVSNLVLTRACLARGTAPGRSAKAEIRIPGADRLRALAEASFLSDTDLEAQPKWLRDVIDTLAVNPGDVASPCENDITEDQLYITPFLRLEGGYQVVLPLDLLVTIRFHLLRLATESGEAQELGLRWREAVFARLMRALPVDAIPQELEQAAHLGRYLIEIDERRALHVILATDPLDNWDWQVWGHHDSSPALKTTESLMAPTARAEYSSAQELMHLVLTDSPGRSAFWGVPNVEGADPVLIARADDIEVILSHEPDGLLGLLLFAQAHDNQPGHMVSFGILDEYSTYLDSEKSFYVSDHATPSLRLFQVGDGLILRQRQYLERDPHSVATPGRKSILIPIQRRYPRDLPEVFIAEAHSSYFGYVVVHKNWEVFITTREGEREPLRIMLELLECTAYWVNECIQHLSEPLKLHKLELTLQGGEAFHRSSDVLSTRGPAIRTMSRGYEHSVEFTEQFQKLLSEPHNSAERELVKALLTGVFKAEASPERVEAIAPLGAKRMLHAMTLPHMGGIPSRRLPYPRKGHGQVAAQILDELGEWMTSPGGGGFTVGPFASTMRVPALNAAVGHLFNRLESEIGEYDNRALLDLLISQNEALVQDMTFNQVMLPHRIACFGTRSDTVSDLVTDRKESASAQVANRFLIEYAAAQPPHGVLAPTMRDYYTLLALASEIISRGTTSDYINYGLADFQVSILESGRLGINNSVEVTKALERYAQDSASRSVQSSDSRPLQEGLSSGFDVRSFVQESDEAMRAEHGFTLTDLRAVCSGLLGTAEYDLVNRVERSAAVATISRQFGLAPAIVSAVLDGITLKPRSSFLEIGADAYPWRFNRNNSYVKRPVVLDGNDLVFGYRGVYRLGPQWLDGLLSGRSQGKARTAEMRRCISNARGRLNAEFAESVARALQAQGMVTRTSVTKIGGRRLVDHQGKDIGDVDVLALHPESRSLLAIEAKDFELARTPAELANELEKLFTGKSGKKATVELHDRRLAWLRDHLDEVIAELGLAPSGPSWKVLGAIVTSEPLVTPLMSRSHIPVVPLENLNLEQLVSQNGGPKPPGESRRRGGRGRRR